MRKRAKWLNAKWAKWKKNQQFSNCTFPIKKTALCSLYLHLDYFCNAYLKEWTTEQ